MAESNTFSLRIVTLDYYMASPIPGLDISYSSFHGGKVNEVPVIRIYGSTPAGQKTCLHVHRVLPYLYVACADIPIQHKQEGDAYTHQISLALENALKLKSKASSKQQYVHGCSLVRGKKFYGYHSSEELFVKIYLYRQQDVSRAANILLSGGVLDKCLQPHEAHIPYILQFLIDYNLFGMGHVHLSKVKFRHPVPDVFSPCKSVCTKQARQDKELITNAHPHSMADLSESSSLLSPIWISSTIPADWMWHSPNEFDESSSNLETNTTKRQSLCQLEGDALVDEILNQQCKTYTPLSQTRSDVKLVQSLVPIWEEEYDRTGSHDVEIPTDPRKPLPEDVLKTLRVSPEFLVKHIEHINDEEIFSYSTPLDKDVTPQQLPISLEREGDSVAQDHISENFGGDTSECFKEKDIIESLISQEEVDAIPSLKRVAIVKAADAEAIGLLKWLASSQALDDINSDDELLRESILSPFLPENTIEEVLEKANMEFESESQKECQEILDSIHGIITANCMKERADFPDNENSYGTSSEKSIPQVDGAGDDLLLTPGCSAETNIEIEHDSKIGKSHQQPVLMEDAPLENKAAGGSDSSFTHEHKKKKKKTLWGSLPLCVNQNSKNEQESTNFCTQNRDPVTPSPISACRGGQLKDSLMENLKETTPLVGCSVRDLMRRKRHYRVEPVQCISQGVEKVPFETRLEEHTNILQKHSDFQMLNIDEPNNKPSDSSNICPPLHVSESMLNEVHDGSATDGDSPLNENFCSHKIDFDSSRAATQSWNLIVSGPLDAQMKFPCSNPRNPDLAPMINDCGIEPETDVELLRSDRGDNASLLGLEPTDTAGSFCFQLPIMRDKLSGRIGGKDGLSEECLHEMSSEKPVGTNTSTVANMTSLNIEHNQEGKVPLPVKTDSRYTDLISLTFCRKPPATDMIDRPSRKTMSCPDKGPRDGTSGKAISDFCPFFTDDCQEGTEIQNNCMKTSDSSLQQDSAIGVPVLNQNDGSFLYLLSPVVSPPPAEKVKRWLSTGTSVGGASTSTKSYPQLGTSSNLISSPSSSPDDYGKASPELCDQHIEAQGSQDNCNSAKTAKNLISNDDAAMMQREGGSASKACSDYSQDNSQISGPDGRSKLTPLSQIGFRDPASAGGGQQLTLLSIEVQAASRGDLRPDPRFDAINLVTLAVQNDGDLDVEVHVLLHSKAEESQRNLDGISGCSVLIFREEKYLFDYFMKFVCSLDPDIIMGWDVQGGSLGFLAERASHLGIGVLNSISRTPSETKMASVDPEIPGKGLDNIITDPVVADPVALEDAIIEDEWGRTHASGVHVGGRIVLNIWRLMRGELKLSMYTMEAVADAVLRRKIPYIPYKVMTRWFSSGSGRARYRCIEYVKERAKLNLELMNQLDMINRTSELARVFGIEFFSVLSRGSQYRVESMYLRLAHTQNYLAISPGSRQVASQPAMECLPLVMEPESGFYADPVVVLDFQSLYPSMIIAYNLCYSTCLGNIALSKEHVLGVSGYSPDPRVLEELKDQILLTPNGVMYAPSKVRKGVLPRLLEEILSTRIMVKQAMKKLSPSQQVLYRIFNARQLALKLISNVTYGYTAAGFSGRMPCAELADSIVQCGRRTLEKAISFVNSQEKWKAKVIYGDTDSMFVLLKGRTVEDAFRIGNEIASEITAMNPKPVILKMEKVYHPCFLLTKKRYVGYSYESPTQAEPVFDAKGIETVRRDTCRAVSKTMEQSLRLFFECQDISEVKTYLHRQWRRILSGRVSLQDFVFAKEVRLGTYSTRGSSSLPPAAIVATKAMRTDPRAEPRYGDRIPYVVIHGQPGARLVDMVVDPLELMAVDSPYRLNDLYYITKQIIPALQRVFGLVGADLNKWFLEMPRQAREAFGKRPFSSNPQRTRIDFYYLSKHCILCGDLVEGSTHLCGQCSRNKTTAITALVARTSNSEREMQHLAAICRHCGGGDWLVESGVKCTSLACPVFYERCKVQKELQSIAFVAADKDLYPKCMVEWF